jgi:hypothetical protein
MEDFNQFSEARTGETELIRHMQGCLPDSYTVTSFLLGNITQVPKENLCDQQGCAGPMSYKPTAKRQHWSWKANPSVLSPCEVHRSACWPCWWIVKSLDGTLDELPVCFPCRSPHLARYAKGMKEVDDRWHPERTRGVWEEGSPLSLPRP